MAIVYTGKCQSLTTYIGTTEVVGGSLTGYVKTITAVYVGTDQDNKNANGVQCQARGVVNIPLADPDTIDVSDLTPYDDLTSSWAQAKIDDHLPNVKEWLDKEIKKQYKPAEQTSVPPWQG